MERRDFLKALLAASVASPLLINAKTSALPWSLYLLSDSPELFLPPILEEICLYPSPGSLGFSVDASHPAGARIIHALERSGWKGGSRFSGQIMSLSFQVLHSPAYPSFTLIRNGKIEDPRTSSLLQLWKKMNSTGETSFLLTVASFAGARRALVPGRRVAVYISGKRVALFPLGKDRLESFPTEKGPVVMAIESGQARVLASTCRHKICQAAPPIGHAGERVVCAPSRFLMEIEGPHLVDTVTG